MLVINGVNYSKHLVSCTVSQIARGESIVNTLAGTQYPYGTGKGYEASITLALIPTDDMRELMNAITGAGRTFGASFLGDGAETTNRLCRAANVSTTLQNVADDGYWSASFTIITVD